MAEQEKKSPRVGRLHNIGGVLSEMGKLYRRYTSGQLPDKEARLGADILDKMAKACYAKQELESLEELSDRLRLIEASHGAVTINQRRLG